MAAATKRLSEISMPSGSPTAVPGTKMGHSKHMVCIIFVAGHGNRLERELQTDADGDLSHLINMPKALLPVSNAPGAKSLLSCWWELIQQGQVFRDVYLVSNADKFKFFERWATANEFPVANIINDGTTTYAARLGSLGDFDLVLRSKNIQEDVLVVAGDTLFSEGFDIQNVVRFFRQKDGELATCYQLGEFDDTSKLGLVEVDSGTRRVTSYAEKPTAEQAESFPSRQGHIVFSCFRPCSFALLQEYLAAHELASQRSFGQYMQWLVGRTPVYGMRIPGGFQLTGDIGLREYREWSARYAELTKAAATLGPITMRAFARVGLLGNPSDGFFGKTISLSIRNFWAQARIVESRTLRLVPHPLNDPNEFGSMADLRAISCKEGYLGGLRLMQATCKKFFEHCTKQGIALPRRNFTLSYDTNIPRQVGLAGSSAIVTCVMKCLMQFFGLTDRDIPKHIQPSFVLSVEMEELFINAGLQDRVIQVYEGLVFMDFNREQVEKTGYGVYHQMRTASTLPFGEVEQADDFPLLWLAYSPDPSDSGKIHNDVKQRWLRGEQEVVDGMQEFGSFAARGKEAIESKDWAQLAELMNANFALRRKLYSDPAIGSLNLEMKRIADAHDCAAKFPGSGGALLGICLDPSKIADLKRDFESNGFVCVEVQPNISSSSQPAGGDV